MAEMGYEQLQIDSEFRSLVRPLRRDEYSQLEVNLTVNGCRDPIIAWNSTIVDGHDQYEICNRLRIPYAIQEIRFISRDAAVAWICGNQLKRSSITEETRKYLIGKRYEAEKRVNSERDKGEERQYVGNTGFEQIAMPDYSANQTLRGFGSRIAWRLGKEYHLSPGTVQKYAKYSQALDTITEKAPELLPQILSGSYKISHENVVALSEMADEEILKLSRRIAKRPVHISVTVNSTKIFLRFPRFRGLSNLMLINLL